MRDEDDHAGPEQIANAFMEETMTDATVDSGERVVLMNEVCIIEG